MTATDPKLSDTFQANATRLATSVEKFGGKAAATFSGGASIAASPLIGPVAKLISLLVVDVVEYDTRRRLRAIIEPMHVVLLDARQLIIYGPSPPLNQAEDPSKSIDEDAKYLRGVYNNWHKERTCALRAARTGGRADAYRLFIESDSEARQAEALLRVFSSKNKLDDLLDKLIKAHLALMSDQIDFDQSLKDLQEAIDGIANVRKAT